MENTLAASFIWGVNTLFLLDAGLSNFQAFLANGFFMLGQVLFEVPTGIVADSFGRRTSYAIGTITLAASTLLYLLMWEMRGPFVGWALSSMLIGLGFTFFSGALEAWLVDALNSKGYKGQLDDVFARGQIVGGIAMLVGSIAGGLVAQSFSIAVPYVLRAGLLILNFITAIFFMKEIGFNPKKPERAVKEMKNIFASSIEHGFGNPPMRWIMLAAPFTSGVSFYVFYALQPFLLDLYGDNTAYAIAGLVAALAATAQIVGGMLASRFRKLFATRTNALIAGMLTTICLLIAASLVDDFWLALAIIFLWGLVFAALGPIRQAYVNGLIPSAQRATVLSFDSLMSSSGGIFIQPTLGRVADVYSYSSSFLAATVIQTIALPFIFLAKKERAESDVIRSQIS